MVPGSLFPIFLDARKKKFVSTMTKKISIKKSKHIFLNIVPLNTLEDSTSIYRSQDTKRVSSAILPLSPVFTGEVCKR